LLNRPIWGTFSELGLFDETEKSLGGNEVVIIFAMTDVTRILNQIEKGNSSDSNKLLQLVYEELRVLARDRLANEKPGQTLQATALVHEAYLRLVGIDQEPHWNGRGHFFCAAAEAMRRILIERARGKARHKRGGDWNKVNFEHLDLVTSVTSEQVLEVDEAIDQLKTEDPLAADLVKLRYFGGISLDQAASAVGISTATAYRHWAYARAWLRTALLNNA
jgi:RNA polymerase sigma factor (TIGR02999 family)